MKLDKGAAGRFIKHAIGSQSVSDAGAGASTSAAVDEEAFRKAADNLLEESDDEDEEAEAQKVVEKVDDVKGKGKSKRPKVDAFAGESSIIHLSMSLWDVIDSNSSLLSYSPRVRQSRCFADKCQTRKVQS